MTAAPSVLIVDDHPIFRSGLAALLVEQGMEVVASVGSSSEALEAAQRLTPDVVLLDLHLPDRSGVETARRLLTSWPKIRILVLTMDSSDAAVLAALRAGAHGYLLKEAAADGVGSAIRSVLHGELVLDARFAARLSVLLAATDRPDGVLAALTPREREIATLITEGCSNAEVGRRLFLAEKTVRNAVTAILAKTGAKDRDQLRVLIAPA